MKICYIFGAAEGLPNSFTKQEEDIVIAADAGIISAEKLGVSVDVAVGDFDSLGFVPCCNEIIKHPIKKDDTDMLLAIKVGFERGFNSFVIFGGTGGRPDHTFANIQSLSFIAEMGGIGYLCYKDYTATVIKNKAVKFSDNAGGNVSVFSISDISEGVNLKNLLYPLENATLKSDFPLGVSNEFVGQSSEISVNNGLLLVIWEGNIGALEDDL